MSIVYKIDLASEIKDSLLDAIDCDWVWSIYTHELEKTKNNELTFTICRGKLKNCKQNLTVLLKTTNKFIYILLNNIVKLSLNRPSL